MGRFHRSCGGNPQPRARRAGVPAVGQLCAVKGQGHRPGAPPGLEGAASFAAVGAPRLPGLPAFLKDQRPFAATWSESDRLVAATAQRAGPHFRRRLNDAPDIPLRNQFVTVCIGAWWYGKPHILGAGL
ncbi:hypothetical protein XFF6994_3470004 [Xanthomonas citri pv. fuscans]|nr:hypothetical protein XFF6990_140629 [Xanthomonas citri pv. fuscans]SOO34040.1 hypothetical protein XFF6994_3470004 [Xanthomonas citri pv. fuscans]